MGTIKDSSFVGCLKVTEGYPTRLPVTTLQGKLCTLTHNESPSLLTVYRTSTQYVDALFDDDLLFEEGRPAFANHASHLGALRRNGYRSLLLRSGAADQVSRVVLPLSAPLWW